VPSNAIGRTKKPRSNSSIESSNGLKRVTFTMMFSLNQSGAKRRARNMGGAGGISRAAGCAIRPDPK
jgi:hypothetical protein